jgi:hypothetical protein
MTKPRSLATAFGLVAILSLAACGGMPVEPVTSDAASAEPAKAQDVAEASPASARAAEPPEPARRALVPVTELRGMTSEQVSQLLGTPQFQRNEAPVEFWQYRGDGCVLHVFLYRGHGGLRVQYAEVRSRAMAAGSAANRAMMGTPADECLAKLAAARPSATS